MPVEMSGGSGFRKSRVWKSPSPVGVMEGLRGVGTIAAPLLAGFSLAAIATVASADSPPPLTDYAIAALALTSVLMLFALQFSFLALQHAAPPEQRLDWHPEAAMCESVLETERRWQARDLALMNHYVDLTKLFYDVGLLFLIGGLILLIVPASWTAARIVAVVIAVLAGAVEAFWIFTWRLGDWRWLRGVLGPIKALHARLLPSYGQVMDVGVSELDDLSRRSILKEYGSGSGNGDTASGAPGGGQAVAVPQDEPPKFMLHGSAGRYSFKLLIHLSNKTRKDRS